MCLQVPPCTASQNDPAQPDKSSFEVSLLFYFPAPEKGGKKKSSKNKQMKPFLVLTRNYLLLELLKEHFFNLNKPSISYIRMLKYHGHVTHVTKM